MGAGGTHQGGDVGGDGAAYDSALIPPSPAGALGAGGSPEGLRGGVGRAGGQEAPMRRPPPTPDSDPQPGCTPRPPPPRRPTARSGSPTWRGQGSPEEMPPRASIWESGFAWRPFICCWTQLAMCPGKQDYHQPKPSDAATGEEDLLTETQQRLPHGQGLVLAPGARLSPKDTGTGEATGGLARAQHVTVHRGRTLALPHGAVSTASHPSLRVHASCPGRLAG